jgi:hypothetical protein
MLDVTAVAISMRLTQRATDPRQRTLGPHPAPHQTHDLLGKSGPSVVGRPGTRALGLGDVRLKLTRPIGAFSGWFRGLKLVPSKRRYLVPPRRIEPVEITSE